MPDSAFWTNCIFHMARAGFHFECFDTMPNFNSGTRTILSSQFEQRQKYLVAVRAENRI